MSVGNFTIEIEFAAEEKVAKGFYEFIFDIACAHSQLAVFGAAIDRRSDNWPPPDPKDLHARVGSGRFIRLRSTPNSRRSPTPLSRTGDLLTERNPT